MILLKVALKHQKSKSKINQHRVVKMTPSWENHHSTVTGAPANHRLRRTLFYMQRTFTSLKLSKYFSNNYLIHNFQVSRLRNAFCHRSPNAKYLQYRQSIKWQSWLTAIFKPIKTFWKPGANPCPELPLSALNFLLFSVLKRICIIVLSYKFLVFCKQNAGWCTIKLFLDTIVSMKF